MNPILRNIIAVIAGVIFGSIVNMGLISISGSVIPPPEGIDPSDIESLKMNAHLFEPKHYLFPFLAHALGTFAGAFLTALIALNHKIKLALIIGLFFLIGGIYMVFLVPAPTWFEVLDLALAYIPMAWIGGKMGAMINKK